jgi:hypothetical protein
MQEGLGSADPRTGTEVAAWLVTAMLTIGIVSSIYVAFSL